jgi:hypothetical protein
MTAAPQNLGELINMFIDLINAVIPVLAGLSLLVFFFGLVKFISQAGDAASHEVGKKLMIWGLIAIFIMVSYLSIIAMVYKDFGFRCAFKNFGPRLPTTLNSECP